MLRIEITQECIDVSSRDWDGCDPVSLAVRPMLREGWRATCGTLTLVLRRERHRVRVDLGRDAAHPLTEWLHHRPVEPFMIELDLDPRRQLWHKDCLRPYPRRPIREIERDAKPAGPTAVDDSYAASVKAGQAAARECAEARARFRSASSESERAAALAALEVARMNARYHGVFDSE